MSTPWTGLGHVAGLGEETTYGTAVSRTNWLPVISDSLKRVRTRVPVPHLSYNGVVGAHRDTFVSEDMVSGQIAFVAAYDDSTALLLKYCFGTVATSGAGPYVHTYTFSDIQAPPTSKKALTIESVRGDSGRSEVFEGCMVSSWEFSVARGQLATLSLNVIGETSARGSAGSPSMHSGVPTWIAHGDVGTVDFNSQSYTAASIKVSVDNKLTSRQLLGSVFTKQPVQNAPREVTLEVELEYSVANPHTEYTAGTQGDCTISCTTAGNEQLDITVHNAIVVDVSDPVTSHDVIRQTVILRGYDDGTDAGLKFVLTNDNSAHSQN